MNPWHTGHTILTVPAENTTLVRLLTNVVVVFFICLNPQLLFGVMQVCFIGKIYVEDHEDWRNILCQSNRDFVMRSPTAVDVPFCQSVQAACSPT